MIVVASEGEAGRGRSGTAERLGAVAALVGWFVVAALIAASYMGRSSSPYGTCYASSGRSVPCALVRR
jgi:hypothetical protein